MKGVKSMQILKFDLYNENLVVNLTNFTLFYHAWGRKQLSLFVRGPSMRDLERFFVRDHQMCH